jgi:hypothetical protein
MQTKLSQPTLFFAIALLILSSCEKAPNAILPDKGTIAVSLHMGTEITARNLQVGDPISDGTHSPFPKSGYLFFNDVNGQIQHRFTIGDYPKESDLDANYIYYDELQKGVFSADGSRFEFKDVNSNVDNITIIANIPDAASGINIPDVGDNISALAGTFSFQTLDKPYMTGNAQLVATGQSSGLPDRDNVPLYRATVNLRATFAIIEIQGIGAMGDEKDPITSFTLDRIVINTSHGATTLSGAPQATSATSEEFPVNGNEGNLTNNMTVSPNGDQNQVWHFLLFADHYDAPPTLPNGTQVEFSMVLHLSDIERLGGSVTPGATIEIKELPDNNGNPIHFQAGRLYRLFPTFEWKDVSSD